MTARPTPDPDTDTIHRYVIGQTSGADARYLKLLHGNFTGSDEASRSSFVDALRQDARTVTDAELTWMLQPGGLPNWRSRLVAAWLVGIDRRTHFRTVIGELLLGSEVAFSGQGYCIALAAMATEDDAPLLVTYLDRYLPEVDLRYDQHWAMGALVYLDTYLKTHHADQFLGTGGAWQHWNGRYPGYELEISTYESIIRYTCGL